MTEREALVQLVALHDSQPIPNRDEFGTPWFKRVHEHEHKMRMAWASARAVLSQPDTIEALQAERDALRADAERLRIRGEAYETAYGIAYQATYQSHNGHWDATMRGGLGCRECTKAREARENCDAALRDGLEKLIERAARTGSKT